jgi:hypothetical protein
MKNLGSYIAQTSVLIAILGSYQSYGMELGPSQDYGSTRITVDLSGPTMIGQTGHRIADDQFKTLKGAITLTPSLEDIKTTYQDSLTSIIKLDLNSNFLANLDSAESVTQFALDNLPNLEILDLSFNRFSADAIINFTSLLLSDKFKYLCIVGNPGASAGILDLVRHHVENEYEAENQKTIGETINTQKIALDSILNSKGDISRIILGVLGITGIQLLAAIHFTEAKQKVESILQKIIWVPKQWLESKNHPSLSEAYIAAHTEYYKLAAPIKHSPRVRNKEESDEL